MTSWSRVTATTVSDFHTRANVEHVPKSPWSWDEEHEGATVTTYLAQNTEVKTKAARPQDKKTMSFKSLAENTMGLPCHEVSKLAS